LADRYVNFKFVDFVVNIWTSDNPLQNPQTGHSNADIDKCGYKTFRMYRYGDSKLAHFESALDTDWDHIPENLLDIWSKRGI